MRALPLPDTVTSCIEVFELALDLHAPLLDDDWKPLDDDERLRARRLQRHPDRVRFVRTRGALRRLLGERLRRRPQDLRFSFNCHGKPRLRRYPLGVNVSHAGSFALIAVVAEGAVGVDIERRDPSLDLTELQPLVLSPLVHRLQRLTVLKPDDGRHRYGLRHETFDLSPVTACRLPAPAGYAASLAWLGLPSIEKAVS